MITVFGGTGLLGRTLVRRLTARGESVRVAARRPDSHPRIPGHAQAEPVAADIREEAAVARALEGAQGVVNAVGLYVEGQGITFREVHVDGAARLARLAHEHHVARLVHISGLGADPASHSRYVAARGQGEAAVRGAFPQATILRPSVLFGPHDAFLRNLERVSRLPVVPLFGRGRTRLQPVHVGDVAEAAVQALRQNAAQGRTYELGGAEVLTYREILQLIMAQQGRWRPVLPVPFTAWKALAVLASFLPDPPLTRDQVALLERDSTVASEAPGFAELAISPAGLRQRLPECLPPRGA